MHHIRAGRAPQYLSDCVSTVSALGGRYRLRSTGSADYVLPRTSTKFGERGFSYCGPAAWNTLPSDLYDITDTDTFRKRLKSVLFDRAYHWILLALLDMSYSGALQILRWLIDWLIVPCIHCGACRIVLELGLVFSLLLDIVIRLFSFLLGFCSIFSVVFVHCSLLLGKPSMSYVIL